MDQTVESFCAGVVELADTLDLGSSAQAWGFDSPLPQFRRLAPTLCLETAAQLCLEVTAQLRWQGAGNGKPTKV